LKANDAIAWAVTAASIKARRERGPGVLERHGGCSSRAMIIFSAARSLASLLSVLAAIVVGGCAADANGGSDGSPPQLVSVTLDKTEITHGTISAIKVTLAYADADADVASVVEQATADGTSNPPQTLSLSEAGGQKEGSQALELQLAPVSAGTISLSFWLLDAKGHESAKVTKTVTAS
jgi:hypothetical protein